MAKKGDDIKVALISYTDDPEQNVAAAIRQCYSSVGAIELKEKINQATRERLIKQVLQSGHTSTLEHASFTFAIEGLSRVIEIHLIRHRIGTAYSIQSGRYVKRTEAKFTSPPSFEKMDEKLKKEVEEHFERTQELYGKLTEAGVPAEDARYVQPQSIQTKLVVTMNARSLLHFFNVRCCRRSQWETQILANKMLNEVKAVAPTIFSNAGPSCRTEKVCWEGNLSCGLWKSIEGAQERSRA